MLQTSEEELFLFSPAQVDGGIVVCIPQDARAVSLDATFMCSLCRNLPAMAPFPALIQLHVVF